MARKHTKNASRKIVKDRTRTLNIATQSYNVSNYIVLRDQRKGDRCRNHFRVNEYFKAEINYKMALFTY